MDFFGGDSNSKIQSTPLGETNYTFGDGAGFAQFTFQSPIGSYSFENHHAPNGMYHQCRRAGETGNSASVTNSGWRERFQAYGGMPGEGSNKRRNTRPS